MLKPLSQLQAVLCVLLLGAFFMCSVSRNYAQSQALNGQIEGIITDVNGAALPNAAITVRNIETGAERQLTSDESGIYRAPLLPLGTYRITVELPNFKRLVRDGITINTGQTATVQSDFGNGRCIGDCNRYFGCADCRSGKN